MEIVEGFVTKCTKYKDNDAILNIINTNGEDSILIRGAYSKNSKFLKFARSFYYAKFETYKGPTAHKKLKDASIGDDYNLLFNNYDELPYLELIKEVFLKTYNIEDNAIYFKLIITILTKIKDTKNILKYTFLFVAYAFKLSGYGLDTNLKCGSCGDKDSLCGISISNGNFVCDNCILNDDVELEKNEIEILHTVFNNKFNISDKAYDSKNIDAIKLIRVLCYVFMYHSDTKIISLQLI